MSSRLSHEISTLAASVRLARIHDQDAIKELTIVVGYTYLADSHPQCWAHIRKHLQAFIDLVCSGGHTQLCEHSSRIIRMFEANELTDAA